MLGGFYAFEVFLGHVFFHRYDSFLLLLHRPSPLNKRLRLLPHLTIILLILHIRQLVFRVVLSDGGVFFVELLGAGWHSWRARLKWWGSGGGMRGVLGTCCWGEESFFFFSIRK